MPFILKTKICLFVASGAVWLMSLASCGRGVVPSLNTKTLQVSKVVPLDDAVGAPSCKIEMSVDYAADSDSIAAKINFAIGKMLFDIEGLPMEQAADSFVSKYTEDYVSFLKPFYHEDNGDMTKQQWYDYCYRLDADIVQADDGVVSSVAKREFFEGGAHSIEQKVVANFEQSTGDMIRLADVFVPGYEVRLVGILQEQLMQVVGASDIQSLRDKGYLYSSDMFVSNNFLLGKDGVTFIYNPYEIAPYEVGITELTLDYDDIEDILKR